MSATPERKPRRLSGQQLAEIETEARAHFTSGAEPGSLSGGTLALFGHIAALGEDTERMDWLESMGLTIWGIKYRTAREAIDAARSTPERGDPEGTKNG